MLHLAKADRNDVFYDLGCGRAQLCVVALTEFGVKRAVGIESHRARAKKARQYIRSLGLFRRIEIRAEDFYDSDLSRATLVYNGLMEDEQDLQFYQDNLKKRSRLVTLSLPLVGVMPNAQDYPFYLMRMPFRKTRDVHKWTSEVLSKRSTLGAFFTEMGNDPDYLCYKRTLKSLMKKRFDLTSRS